MNEVEERDEFELLINSLTQNYPYRIIKRITHELKFSPQMWECKMGVVINDSLSLVNATSHSLENWKDASLAGSEDNGLPILLKFLMNLQ